MENFHIIFSDKHLAILTKKAGVAIQSQEQSIHSDLHQLFPNQSIFLVNRIDQPVSGLFVIAFSEEVERKLRTQWEGQQVFKNYLAICEKEIEGQGELHHQLIKAGNKAKVVLDSSGKSSTLSYQLFGKSEKYFGYLIQLKTGRFHQIRAQLAHAGASIKGDLKYGAKRSNPGGGIGLHSFQIEFKHPITSEKLKFEANPPKDNLWDFFKALLP
jgi:23S rRNA pseudouridine1911/1915/1917 synthase